jgi:hypothetical protein
MPPIVPLEPVPGVVKINLAGSSSVRNWENVFHAQYSGSPPTAAALDSAALDLGAVFAAELAPQMPADGTIETVTITDLSSSSGAQAIFNVGTPGSNVGAIIPASAAFLVNYNSSFRYRGGHPRTYYFVGVQADLLNQSTWTPTFVDAMQAAASAVHTALGSTAGGLPLTSQCAVSYVTAGSRRLVPVIMPITTATATNGVATQRRRLRKR